MADRRGRLVWPESIGTATTRAANAVGPTAFVKVRLNLRTRAINPGDERSLTVTHSQPAPQVRPHSSPDGTDSQADSASSYQPRLHLWWGWLWLTASLEFDVLLGGELEDLRRWGDLSLRGPQDRIRVRRPAGGQSVPEGSPVRVLAGRHPVLSLVDCLAGCMVLCGKVADPGGRLGWPAVAFGVGVGEWFGGAQRFDLVAGVTATQWPAPARVPSHGPGRCAWSTRPSAPG